MHIDESELATLVAGTLVPERRRALDSHLATCGTCARRYVDLCVNRSPGAIGEAQGILLSPLVVAARAPQDRRIAATPEAAEATVVLDAGWLDAGDLELPGETAVAASAEPAAAPPAGHWIFPSAAAAAPAIEPTLPAPPRVMLPSAFQRPAEPEMEEGADAPATAVQPGERWARAIGVESANPPAAVDHAASSAPGVTVPAAVAVTVTDGVSASDVGPGPSSAPLTSAAPGDPWFPEPLGPVSDEEVDAATLRLAPTTAIAAAPPASAPVAELASTPSTQGARQVSLMSWPQFLVGAAMAASVIGVVGLAMLGRVERMVTGTAQAAAVAAADSVLEARLLDVRQRLSVRPQGSAAEARAMMAGAQDDSAAGEQVSAGTILSTADDSVEERRRRAAADSASASRGRTTTKAGARARSRGKASRKSSPPRAPRTAAGGTARQSPRTF